MVAVTVGESKGTQTFPMQSFIQLASSNRRLHWQGTQNGDVLFDIA